ncbi:isochorismate synthase [Microlunatus endophyticus]|uniref:isochorismate synthase n=1 Tax=Microlunatus endophyticus TaxID=1716077 RepID=A0A917S9Z0_9ACTN|nr:isochorismate synthase [Microlunatus endophyticus]GGL63800.1 isochorismate synthase [Microlunatus endophyticus]
MRTSAPGPVERPRLLVATEEIADPGPLADAMPDAATTAWIRRGEGMIGYGEAARHKATSLADAEQWWRELRDQLVVESALGGDDLPGTGFVAFGSFVFDPDNTAAESVLIIPELIIGRRAGRAWRTTIRPSDAPPISAPRIEPVEAPGAVTFADGKLSGPEWEQAVAEAVGRIMTTELDKVVLARELVAIADSPIDPRRLVSRLSEEYATCWTYHVDGLVGATPEMLVRREAGLATSRVLAGTIRRSADAGQDLALAASLAHSSKDLEEHEYAVTSVARALAPYCSGMNVPDAPYVLELPNVLHLATDVTAVAAPEASSLALAAALHPSAAVCGTPTALARSTIAELEHLDRDRYAGPVGWIDADGDGEWAIALRCGRIDADDPRQIRLYAGCGIVGGSNPEAELAESVAKLVPMRDALAG